MIACHEKISSTVINRLPIYFYCTCQPSLVTVVKVIGILSFPNQLITRLHILPSIHIIQLISGSDDYHKIERVWSIRQWICTPLVDSRFCRESESSLAKVPRVRGERVQHSKVTKNICHPSSNEYYNSNWY